MISTTLEGPVCGKDRPAIGENKEFEPHMRLQDEIDLTGILVERLTSLHNRIVGLEEQAEVNTKGPMPETTLRSVLVNGPGQLSTLRAQCLDLVSNIESELFT